MPQLVSGSLPEIYGDMKLKSWLETRRSAKHRAEIARMLRNLRMTDLKSFIDVSLGLTLTDTLWVKEEHSDSKWADVNLYDNEFSEIVSQTAFMGGISDLSFKTTSSEYGTVGRQFLLIHSMKMTQNCFLMFQPTAQMVPSIRYLRLISRSF